MFTFPLCAKQNNIHFSLLHIILEMSSLTKDQIISKIYYDLETGCGSVKNTFEQARQKDKSITLEDVQKWVKQQPSKQRKAYRNPDNN